MSMPNVAQVLKLEIKRIAAKELRASGLAAKVKSLNRRIRELEKRLKAAEARPAAAPAQPSAAPLAAPMRAGGRFKATPAAIKSLRARLGVTQIGLAKLLGGSHSAVVKWEAGRMKPVPKTVAALQALDARAAAVPVRPPVEAPAYPHKRGGRRFRATPKVFKRIRDKLDITQAELAVLLGASHNAVYLWEAGRMSPRTKTVAALRELEFIGKREARRRLAAK
jgi:DNA-binding transcriptional regulator YiaG